jgi:two-component system, chemotaxis family, chemotaxis protein CheY
MKCLVVDASPVMRRIFANVLRRVGCDEVVEMEDGRRAIELADAGTDLVITAWNMPGMGGLEMTKRLRENAATSSVRVIMVTPRNTRDDVLQAIEAGVNGYVLKPFRLEVLQERVEQLLRRDEERAAA